MNHRLDYGHINTAGFCFCPLVFGTGDGTVDSHILGKYSATRLYCHSNNND